MIVRNEEEFIAQCIQSVKPIISEIIVVDTGSTDKTVEIATSLGATILTYRWNDDFSPPRNLSIQNAKSDWILVLDADEAIATRDLTELQKLTLSPHTCYEFLQRHYSNDQRISGYIPNTGEYPEWERNFAGYFESNLCRLFPNHRGVHYQGRVHELVEHSIRNISALSIVRTRIPLHHYGHTPEVKKKKNKGALYTPLGTQKLRDDPNYWQAWFELGVEHNNNGHLEESATALSKALELNPLYLPTWINLGYVLCELGAYDRSEKILRTALEIDTKSEEAWCNLGVVYLRSNKFPFAEKCFRNALAIKPEYVNALCNLGKTLAALGRISEGVFAYKRALEFMPSNITAKMDLGYIYLSSSMHKEAEQYLAPLAALPTIPPQIHFLLGEVYSSLQRTEEAISALTTFCTIGPQSGAQEAELSAAKQKLEQLRPQAIATTLAPPLVNPL